MNRKNLITISISGAVAVALGAMGAHFLKSKISEGLITIDQVNSFDTGVKYQMYHTLAMLVLVVINHLQPNKYFAWANAFFFWGIILFSGSIYFLSTRNLFGADWLKMLGPITPLGGICFIIGWLCLSLSVLKSDKNKSA